MEFGKTPKRKTPKRKTPKSKTPKRKTPKRKTPTKLKSRAKKLKKSARKPCKRDEFRSMKTGRCVKKDNNYRLEKSMKEFEIMKNTPKTIVFQRIVMPKDTDTSPLHRELLSKVRLLNFSKNNCTCKHCKNCSYCHKKSR